jgi:hypothetical protein
MVTIDYVPAALTVSKPTFYIYGFSKIASVNRIISLNSVKNLILVMVKCGVLFVVRTEFLNIV